MRQAVLGVVLMLSLAAPAEAKKLFYADAAESLLEKSGSAERATSLVNCGQRQRFYCVFSRSNLQTSLAAYHLQPRQIDKRDSMERYIYTVPFAGHLSTVALVKLVKQGDMNLYLAQEIKEVSPFSTYLSDLMNDFKVKQ